MNRRLDAFIPLKGHSARVPGKNMRPFNGAPLFHTIVHTLRATRAVDRVFIDTDSEEIAASATELGVEVIRRDPALIGDDVSVNLLIRAFLDRVAPDHVIQTHATNPLLTAGTIDRAADRYFDDGSATSVFAVTRYQARFYREGLLPVNHDPTELIPTQDLDPLYMENSNFYIFAREAFLVNERRITDDAVMFEMDPIEAVDIDEERDFALAIGLSAARRPGRAGD